MPYSRSSKRNLGRYIAREQEERRKQKVDIIQAKIEMNDTIARQKQQLSLERMEPHLRAEYEALLSKSDLTVEDTQRLIELTEERYKYGSREKS